MRLSDDDRVHEDCYHVKRFVQRELGMNPDTVHDAILATAPWTDPAHPDLLYRGHELRRQKAFWNRAGLTADINAPPDLLYRYRYPGAQFGSLLFYRPLAHTPIVHQLTTALQAHVHPGINHVIATHYRNGDDEIGFHSDKIKDIRPDTPIISLSFGETRELHMMKLDGTDRTVHVLEPGDLFILGWRTNMARKHAIVPVADEVAIERDPNVPIGSRISLVFRDIKTTIPLATARQKAQVTRVRRARVQAARTAAQAEQAAAQARVQARPTNKRAKKSAE